MKNNDFRRRIALILSAGAALLAGVSNGALGSDGPAGPTLARARAAAQAQSAGPARVIVKYRAEASEVPDRARIQAVRPGSVGPQAAATLGQRHGLALTDGRAIDARTQLVLGTGLDSRALRDRLAADPDVEAAWVDHLRFPAGVVPDDPLFAAAADGSDNTRVQAGQWYLRKPTADLVSSIDAQSAWQITWGDPSMVVAVLDTGIRPEHPDLQGKILPGYDFISDRTHANDGDGRDADPTDPGDWITSSEDASGTFKGCGQSDSSWHGTQVAGIIAAATDNGMGMAGAARDTKVVPVRVLGKCGGYDSDIVVAMRWAAGITVPNVPTNAHPARVLNMSLGGTNDDGSPQRCSDTAYQDAFDQLVALNVFVAVAAGNESRGVEAPGNCNGAVAVVAIRTVGTKVGFSSLGPQASIAAPGGNCVNTGQGEPCLYPILTTANTGTTTAKVPTYTNSFGELSLGTSFSTPQVAAVAALMLSVNPALTEPQLLSMMKSSARPFPTTGGGKDAHGNDVTACTPTDTVQDECYCTTSTCGAGMLDARAAVTAAAGVTGAVADAEPSTRMPGVGETVTIDGSLSAPTAGATITSYAWSIVNGGGSANIAGAANGPTLTLTTTNPGSVLVELVVTDSTGAVGKAFRSFTVQAPPPVAVISGSDGVRATDVMTLSSTDSTVPEGRTIAYREWSVGPSDTAITLSAGIDSSTVVVHGVSAGTATVTLTITDSTGATATATHAVTVTPTEAQGGGGGSGSSGGGGAFGVAAMATLLLAIAVLRRGRRGLESEG